MHRPSLTGDYPRVGGEKASQQEILYGQQGSPPRMRGKEQGAGGRMAAHGITPAWAGKSLFCFTAAVPIQDHPRMGGEKANGNDAPDDDEGSPPHGQGKDDVFRGQILLPGITPA